MTPGCGRVSSLTALVTFVICGHVDSVHAADRETMKFANLYRAELDDGTRAGLAYSLHRAWGEVTRDKKTAVAPRTQALDLDSMASKPFAVAWLGHASLLVRAGTQWILVDPVFADTVGPAPGLGPQRLAPLPISPKSLPHIDVVLISHNHYDHLDLAAVKGLAVQTRGAPHFLAGKGIGEWFKDHTHTECQGFDWWQSQTFGDVQATFVPAQHSSGRKPWDKNSTLWGGWVIRYSGLTFYFAGDTSYEPRLFAEIRRRIGPIDLASLPIGAYLPRRLMRFEHMDPQEALLAHVALGAKQSFGVHWGTFQLGDEGPLQAASQLTEEAKAKGLGNFGLMPIGAAVEVSGNADLSSEGLTPPLSLDESRWTIPAESTKR